MKNIRFLFLVFVILTALSACTTPEDKQRELDLKERELALKEKELELNQKPKEAVNNTERQGTISGNSVIMRRESSVESAKIGNFENGEKVSILEERKPQNVNQAIAVKSIKLYSDYNGKYMAVLNKGKALMIEEFTGTDYKVSFQHPELGKLYATVTPAELESISNEVWFRVKRVSGEEGWVLGKFVK